MIEPITPIDIPRILLQQVYEIARQEYPNECCGWLAGDRGGSVASVVRSCVNTQATGGHPTKSDRTAETAYVMTGADLLALDQSLDSDRPALVIYHSHPNGQAYFSSTDREVARDPFGGNGPAYPVQQLVIGVLSERVVEAALFAWSETDNDFVEIDRYDGDTQ